ncbi:FAD dependent oxidoreductase [Zychaea mexicana]|uniref:FAD dependent oxidoreductase n=1 Tax=Zychaea mexicana TaxID=64656 RepID=UPI0022FE074B|nr:FAD dependent oxidoreductase [Zychaea mexicana]KAI9494563.1 FAD dependent oxidoreductase [Zychaea mexicana]
MHLNPISTQSYWLNNAPFQTPSKDPLPSEADIVIIGAGLTGMSTAYWLMQMQPNLKVVVADARGVASGATGRNGGIMSPGLNDDFDETVAVYGAEAAQQLIDFDYRNVDMLTQFLKENADQDKGFFDPELTFTKGTIIAWSTIQEAEEGRPAAESLCKRVKDMRIISPEELKQIPGFESFQYGGLHIKTTAIAWAAKIVFCLARYVAKQGVRFATHTKVDNVVWDEKRSVNAIYTDKGIIEAPRVAYCTNAWTARLLEPVRNVLVPVRNQVVSVRSPAGAPRLEYVLSADRGYQYLSCRPNGDIIFGGMRNVVPGKQEYEDDDSTLNTAVSQALRKFMADVVNVPSVEREWAGVMGFTKDRMPLLGSVEHITGSSKNKGQYVAAGFTGHGMPRTFLCGRAIAQLLTGQDLDDWFPPEFLVEHPSRQSWWNSNIAKSHL